MLVLHARCSPATGPPQSDESVPAVLLALDLARLRPRQRLLVRHGRRSPSSAASRWAASCCRTLWCCGSPGRDRAGAPRVGDRALAVRRHRARRCGTCACCGRLPADPPPVAEPVAVLLPVRDEAQRVEPCLRSLLAPDRGPRPARSWCSTTGRPTGPPTSYAGSLATDPRVTSRRRRAAGRLVGQAVGLPAARPATSRGGDAVGAGVRRRRRRPRAARGRGVGGAAAWVGLDLVSPVPPTGRRVRRRAAGAAAAAVVVAHDPAAAGRRGVVAAAVARRRQRPAARRRHRRLPSRRRARRACATQMLEDIALLRAVKRQRRPGHGRRRHARWPPAGCTTAGRRCATAMRSRCGRPSARPRARRRSWRHSALAYVVPPLAALRRVPRRAGRLRRGRRGPGRRRPAHRRPRVAGRRSRTRCRWRRSPSWSPTPYAATAPAPSLLAVGSSRDPRAENPVCRRRS